MLKPIIKAAAVVVVVMLVAVGVFAQTKSAPSVTTFKDSRDGKTYKIVKIGSQKWFAENLNYAANGSKCYGEGGVAVDGWDEDGDSINPTKLSNAEVQANCAKYGRLYNWKTALTACPAGTHLPTDKEWTILVDYVGRETAGKKLKSTAGWNENGNGTDEYAFSALPGGYGYSVGSFGNAGNSGHWWSTTENDAYYAWYRYIYYDRERMYRRYNYKTSLYSVRCVQD